MNLEQSTASYLSSLITKGFAVKEEDIGFIYFGKNYIDLDDHLTNLAIDSTLKVQRCFDGSFYIALLEAFKEENCTNYQEGLHLLQTKGIVSTTNEMSDDS